jgi:hypothetical protein
MEDWEIERELSMIKTPQDLENFLVGSGLDENEKNQVRAAYKPGQAGGGNQDGDRGLGTVLIGGAVAVGGAFLLKKFLAGKKKPGTGPVPPHQATPYYQAPASAPVNYPPMMIPPQGVPHTHGGGISSHACASRDPWQGNFQPGQQQ